jgi:hypothetical protein
MPRPHSLVLPAANLPLNGLLGAPDGDLKPLREVFGNRFPAPTASPFLRFSWNWEHPLV